MKKILFIMLLLSPGIMYAMEDKQVHLQTFRDHINYAKAIGYSMLDQLCKSSITTTTREEGFANIVKAINQLQEDSDIADTLLMTKIRSEMSVIINQLNDLKNAVLRNNNQTPPLPFEELESIVVFTIVSLYGQPGHPAKL